MITEKTTRKINDSSIELLSLMNEFYGYEYVIEDGKINTVICEDGTILDC